jgi:membrane-associated protease RseP (regulator of RpoE activity)
MTSKTVSQMIHGNGLSTPDFWIQMKWMTPATAGPAVPQGMFYEDKPVWKRMVVTLAGVFMNTVFAILVFWGLAYSNGRAIDPETRVGRVLVREIQ